MLLKCIWAVMSKIKESICRRSGVKGNVCKKPLSGLSMEVNHNEEGWRPSAQARHVAVFCLTFKFWSLKFDRGGDFVYFSSHWLLRFLIPQILTITIYRLLFRPINTAPIKTINDKLVSNCIVSQCNSVSFLMDIEIRKKHFFKFFLQEKMFIMDSYQRKARITTKMLNSLKSECTEKSSKPWPQLKT